MAKEFDKTSNLLPSRIELVFEVPKIWEMVQASGDHTVRAFIEFELVKLAERINVSGNLTDGQIQEISGYIVTNYPNETIADFKICFQEAANGAYGKIWKLDGIEVGLWVKAYLDKKYVVLENALRQEKENYKAEAFRSARTSDEWMQLWRESIEKTDKEGGVKTISKNLSFIQSARKDSFKDTKSLAEEYPATSVDYIQKHNEKMRKFQEMAYRERHPGATDEQVKSFLDSIKQYDAKVPKL